MNHLRLQNSFNFLLILLFVVLATYIGLGAWFDRMYKEPPFQYTNLPMKVLPESKTIRAGEPVFLEVNWCSKINYIADVNIRYVNSLIYIAPTLASQRGVVGCQNHPKVGIAVPIELPPGEYHIEGEATTTIKWLIFSKHRSTPLLTETFAIIK